MTTKILAGTYAGGYYVTAPITTLSVAASGYVAGSGVFTPDGAAVAYGVINEGRIKGASRGVYLSAGGSVTNGATASITGPKGVLVAGGLGTVTNSGTITGAAGTAGSGVYLSGGGHVTNGGAGDTTALITGGDGVLATSVAVTVTNLATIEGIGGVTLQAGVYLGAGGVVTNGGATDTLALVEGADAGVRIQGAAGSVANDGTIKGNTGASGTAIGVYLKAGGRITNGGDKLVTALIEGTVGVALTAVAGTVVNGGTIRGAAGTTGVGVYLGDGGVVVNGSTANTLALVHAGAEVVLAKGAVATVSNFGTIGGALGGEGKIAVYLTAGGVITNGGGSDETALIEGSGAGAAIGKAAPGTIVNFASILAAGGTPGIGAYLGDGGRLTNGGVKDDSALIEGSLAGVQVGAGSATIANYGLIEGVSIASAGLLLAAGRVINGPAGDIGATIEGGAFGIKAGPATVVNFGSIAASPAASISAGVYLVAGGVVDNGSLSDTTALIKGGFGIAIQNGGGTVSNDGTVSGFGTSGQTAGVYLFAGGRLVNGAATDLKAMVQGAAGVQVKLKAGTVQNFGTIEGLGTVIGQCGVYLMQGGTLTNGSKSDATALIEGHFGAAVGATGTLINYGTIAGKGGTAVEFTTAKSTLAVEAGSSFGGAVLGGGGTLDLASGAGTITSMTGGDATVTGSIPTATFTNFGTVEIGGGASFTLSGSGAIGAGDSATLQLTGTLAVTGDLIVSGHVAGAGALALQGGSLSLDSGMSLSVSRVIISGGAVSLTTNLSYAGKWAQSAGALTVAAGHSLTFTGASDAFSGTVGGAGAVIFSGGADTLNGATLSAANIAVKSAVVSLQGEITLSTLVLADTPSLIVAAAGATLSGGGRLNLSNNATNRLAGLSGSPVLTNLDDLIDGAGQLGGGKLTLVNDALGAIKADDATGLTLDTGAQTIANAGIIVADGAGGLMILSPVDNTGTLAAVAGTLTAQGNVTGSGVVRISGGLADFAAGFTQNVDFGPSGELELAQSQAYGGTISGFSKSTSTVLDLRDIVFKSGTTKVSYSGTAASGVLTVTDGVHSAHIKLSGDYLASTWTIASDGHGGTFVYDPPAAPIGAAQRRLLGAAAGLEVRPPGPIAASREADGRPAATQAFLSRPVAALA